MHIILAAVGCVLTLWFWYVVIMLTFSKEFRDEKFPWIWRRDTWNERAGDPITEDMTEKEYREYLRSK